MELAPSQRHDPVAYDIGLGQWFVYAYDDVRALLVDERLTPDRMHGFARRAPARALDAVRSQAPWFVGGPQADYGWIGPIVHRGLRKPDGAAFKEAIARAAAQLLQPLIQHARFDLINDYALALSGWMLADFLGVDRRDARRLIEWGQDIIAFFNDVEITAVGAERMARSSRAMVDHAHDVLARRAAGTHDGFLHLAARAARDKGTELDDAAIASITLPLATGYVDAAQLVAITVWLLLSHPDQRARLAADPRLLAGAVSEALRFGSPVALVPRTALVPITVRGRDLEPGERLQLSIASANRDPGRFRAPDRFDIGREQNGALGFGHGRRSCVAAGLARMHTAVAVDVLFRQAEGLALDPDGRVTWSPLPGVHALARCPVFCSPHPVAAR
jgi:cytochrome P450